MGSYPLRSVFKYRIMDGFDILMISRQGASSAALLKEITGLASFGDVGSITEF